MKFFLTLLGFNISRGGGYIFGGGDGKNNFKGEGAEWPKIISGGSYLPHTHLLSLKGLWNFF